MRTPARTISVLRPRFAEVAASLFLLVLAPAFGSSGAASTTTLAVTSGGSPVTTVAAGTVVTLTATVTSGGGPVTPGQVKFCDASATYCEDGHLLGTAQLTSAGTATFKFRPAIGSQSYKAVFLGKTSVAGSSSAVTSLAVTGKWPTTTTYSQGGTSNSATLTATVVGTGTSQESPTGTVSFLNTASGNSVVATAALGAGTAGLDFGGSSTPLAGTGAANLVLADFNGDGILDIAESSGGSTAQISILLGNGDGTFRVGTPIPTTGGISVMVAGDFNGDGKIDLAYVLGGVNVLTGNGDGTFASLETLLPGSGVSSIAIGDFNNDGVEDMVADVDYNDGHELYLLLGTGTGLFTSSTLQSNSSIYQLVAADFNGDGNLDLAGADSDGTSVTVLLGNGDGTFAAAAAPPSLSVQPGSIVTGDFNGDGIPDLALPGELIGSVTVLLGKGDGTFTLQPSTFVVPSSYNGFGASVGDFNGDGVLDIALANDFAADAVVLLGNGDGTFMEQPLTPAAANSSEYVAVGDMNGDGTPDIVVSDGVGNSNTANATVLLTQRTETATATVSDVSLSGVASGAVEANYPGDTNFAASNSLGSQSSPVSTTLVLMLPASSGAMNQPLTLTATLNPYTASGNTTNGELITFYSGSQSLGTVPLSNGVATLPTTPSSSGSYYYSATYGGDANFSSSRSTSVSYTVTGSSAATLVLSASPAASYVGQPVTLTATLNPYAASGESTNGEPITFYSGGASLGSTLLSGGVATLTLIPPSTGSYTYSTAYGGDAYFAGAASNSISYTVSPQITTTLTVTQPPNGQLGPVQLTASLYPYTTAGHNTNGELIEFDIAGVGQSAALTAPLSNGIATMQYTAPAGAFQVGITAHYAGDGVFQAASGSTSYYAVPGPPMSLSVSPAGGVSVGQPVALNVYVSAGESFMDGVRFTDQFGNVGYGVVSDGGASASFTPTTPGTYEFQAVFDGDENYAASTSNVIEYAVGNGASATNLTVSGGESTVPVGAVLALTASVTTVSGPVTRGQVKFCDASAKYCEDSHVLGVAQLTSAGTATLSVVPDVGSHSYSAVFLGTTAIAGSTSPVQTLSVTGGYRYLSSTTIAESGTIGNYTLTATVTGSGTHTVSPTGTVTFVDITDANSVLGTASLGSATAALTFGAGPTVPVSAASEILTDFNGDGYLDVAAVTLGGTTGQPNAIKVLLGKFGTFTQSATLTAPASTDFLGVLSADFNGDGNPDLLAWTNSAVNPFQIFLGNGDGTFVAASNSLAFGSAATNAVVGDFNNDGIEDIVFATSPTITVLLGNGDGTFRQGTPITLPNGATVYGLANALFASDFNGDGKLDLVASCLESTQPIAIVLLGNGDGTFNATIPGGTGGWNINAVGAVADFNGDGIPDLLVTGGTNAANPNFNPAPSQILLGNGDGTFASTFGSSVPYPVNAGSQNVAADVDGDGNLDLVEYNSSGVLIGNQQLTYAVIAYLGNGDGSFQTTPIVLPAVGDNGDRGFAVGDLNGDSLPDVIVLPNSDSADGVVEYTQSTETATASVSGISAPVLGVGNLVEASYPGDTNFAASLSGTVILAASARTTLTLTATPAGSTAAGQPITLTATLSPYTAQGLSTNGEKVTFTSGGTTLGSGTLAGGVATLQITPATGGSVDYAAAYAGDANFGPSSGNLVYTVTTAPTTLVLQASPLGSTVGQSVTLTATLSPASVSTTSSNGETVTFYSGTTSLGTGTLANGVATLTTTALPAGVDSLTAQYAGDGTLGASTSAPVADTVLAIPTIAFSVPNKTYGVAPFTVAATSNSTGAFTYSVVSGPATISGATVTVTGAGTVVLQASQAATSADIAGTQNASFAVAQASLAISANSAARVFGAANPAFTGTVTGAVNGDTFTETFSTTATIASIVGSYPITPAATGTSLADYTVTATPGTLTVSQAGSSTTLALTNGNKTFTATVASLTSGTPTGTVSFYEGQTAVGMGTLSGGIATYTASSFPAGDVVVSAEYSGDPNFTESQSPPILLLGLSLGLDSLTVGQSGSVTDTATVSVVPGYVGTVTFSCTGLPANSSCSFAPASASFTGANASAQVTATIATGVSAQGRLFGLRNSAGVWAAGMLAPGLLGLALAGRRRRLRGLMTILALCGLALGMSACGGSGGGPLTTPTGQTTVQVVASGPEGLSQSSNVTLTVQ